MSAPRRHRLAAAVHVSLLFALPGLAAAQEAPQQQDAVTLDAVQVTGTRIKKAELETQVPVQTLTREDIDRTGLTSIADVVQALTASGSALNTKFNSSGNFGFPPDGSGVGAGSAQVDLRHLGSRRVLVLVDGMRWVNEASASGVGAAVDLNTIPLAIVERIEVLEDGASALYGSDAIAGVVNIITRRNFEGASVSVQYGEYEEGDGATTKADLAWGWNGERSNLFLGASYTDQERVSSADRQQARFPVPGTGVAFGSSGTPTGRFIFRNPNTGVNHDLTPNTGANNPFYDPTQTGCTRTDDYHCFATADRFNFSPFNLVLTPSERAGLFGQFRFDVSDSTSWYVRGLYNRRKSTNQAAPEPIFLGLSAGTGNPRADNIFISRLNPFNPFGFDLDARLSTPAAQRNLFLIGRRPVEGGPRVFEQEVDTWYVGTGVEGRFDVGQRTWFWDANLAYSENQAEQTNFGSYDIRNIALALGDPAACAAVAGCTPLNLFGGPGTITPQMLAFIQPVVRDRSENTLFQATANVTGDLVDLWAGPLSFAGGVEHRRYEGFYQPDALTVAGFYNGVPSRPTSGEYDVSELYTEFNVPLFVDSPLGKSLDLSLAGRYSDYSTFGGEFTGKLGLRWQLVDELLFRATYAEGFRAPSIGELFGSASSDGSRSGSLQGSVAAGQLPDARRAGGLLAAQSADLGHHRRQSRPAAGDGRQLLDGHGVEPQFPGELRGGRTRRFRSDLLSPRNRRRHPGRRRADPAQPVRANPGSALLRWHHPRVHRRHQRVQQPPDQPVHHHHRRLGRRPVLDLPGQRPGQVQGQLAQHVRRRVRRARSRRRAPAPAPRRGGQQQRDPGVDVDLRHRLGPQQLDRVLDHSPHRRGA
jgi:iron complex outermembrane recepter protein